MGSFGKYHGAHCVIDRVATYKPTIAYATTQVFPAGTQPAYQLAGIPRTGQTYGRNQEARSARFEGKRDP